MKRIEVEQRTILVGLVGSHGYGLNRPDSDLDYRGVFIAPKRYYLGFENVEQKDGGWDEPGIIDFLNNNKDTVIYELRKYISLLAGANPNIIELLWLKDYPLITPVGETLIKNRDLFLTKKVKHTYSGYAYAQIKKIESHRKWLLNPPQVKPNPADYGIEAEEPLNKEELNAFLEYLYLLVRGKIEYLEQSEQLYKLITADIDFKGILKQYTLPDEAIDFTQEFTHSRKDFIRLLQRSQAYQGALREWKAYKAWKENRNPARAEMERKSGYDLKHGMHCVRLLRSGVEILRHGQVFVNRHDAGDAGDLKAILRGEYSYEDLMKLAENLMQEMEIAYNHSSLPHRPDMDAINQLCIQLVENYGF